MFLQLLLFTALCMGQEYHDFQLRHSHRIAFPQLYPGSLGNGESFPTDLIELTETAPSPTGMPSAEPTYVPTGDPTYSPTAYPTASQFLSDSSSSKTSSNSLTGGQVAAAVIFTLLGASCLVIGAYYCCAKKKTVFGEREENSDHSRLI